MVYLRKNRNGAHREYPQFFSENIGIMLRPIHPSDRSSIIGLLKLNIPRYFAPHEEADFEAYLSNRVESYYVVEENEMLVGGGGINLFPEERVARLSWDVVHPDHQGKGIGTELTKYRINEIKAQPGIDTIVVRTTQLVYPFYEKMGFTLEKTEPDFWATGFDLYQMTMDLDKN